MTGKRTFGDFQTPLEFTDFVCNVLKKKLDIKPVVVLEPTCGIGNFLKSSLCFDAKAYYGIEINPDYCQRCIDEIADSRVQIINQNIFEYDLKKIRQDKTLILGNPPWVTNSMLSALDSGNVPRKYNFKGLKGIEAITGESNFDICEYIIIQLINAFRNTDSVIAMLCKTSVARNIFKEIKRREISFLSFEIIEFDAKKVFTISAAACLLIVKLTAQNKSPETGLAYDISDIENVKYTFGYRQQKFYSNLEASAEDFDGKCCFEWRQGVKHDCAKIMEISVVDGKFVNGLKEQIDIEKDLLFPLVKSSMFKKPVIDKFSKYVLVTQRKVKQDTQYIQEQYPLTWNYLYKHKDKFDARKSSIYREAPAFSMFGIGDYSYASFKVGLSGFYKEPLFSVLHSRDNKPVMTDDTAYFVCLPTYDMAYVAMLYLNSQKMRSFLRTIAFVDAKRPYTKKVLERIDFGKAIEKITYMDLRETENQLDLEKYLTTGMMCEFAALPEMQQQVLFN